MMIKGNGNTFKGCTCRRCFTSLQERDLILGSKFFPFRVDPFSELAWCARKQVTKVVSLVQQWQNKLPNESSFPEQVIR